MVMCNPTVRTMTTATIVGPAMCLSGVKAITTPVSTPMAKASAITKEDVFSDTVRS